MADSYWTVRVFRRNPPPGKPIVRNFNFEDSDMALAAAQLARENGHYAISATITRPRMSDLADFMSYIQGGTQ